MTFLTQKTFYQSQIPPRIEMANKSSKANDLEDGNSLKRRLFERFDSDHDDNHSNYNDLDAGYSF